MPQLLGRKYRLIFGKPGKQGRVVTGLDVSFECEKTTEAKPNTGNITIYNLSRENRALIEEPETMVTLEAGYEDSMGIIFVGNDLLVQTIKKGVDFETIIRSKDGGKQVAETHVNIDIPEGETMEQSVRKIVKKFNDVTGRNVELAQLPKKKAAKSRLVSKSAKEALTEILEPEGYQWSIQNGEFRVVPLEQGSTETVYVLSSSSGLIGSPEKTRFRLPGKDKDTDGITFTCLMNSEITPLRRVKLESLNIRGIYKVMKVVYRGDYKGTDWYCQVEGIPL